LQNLLQNEWLRAVRFKRPSRYRGYRLFKRVNDTYGTPWGPGDPPRWPASKVCCADSTAWRFGGEEFAILMPETGRREAAIAMERVRAALAQSPCVVSGQDLRIPVTLSIGVAVPLEDADTPDALIAVADRRLYAAKNAGRDTIRVDG
jgi:diguanylate cyclase (GGDEF)-like protein